VDWADELMSPESGAAAGWFRPEAVAGLVRRCRAGQATGFRENQALVAILSTQAWYRQFMVDGLSRAALPLDQADVLMVHDTPAPQLSRAG
jgi:hypothetical protein